MAAEEDSQRQGQSGDAHKPEPEIQIAPGEPVPPGFEGEIEKQAQIQVCVENSCFVRLSIMYRGK